MSFNEPITEFAGLPAVDFDDDSAPQDLSGQAWRIGLDWDSETEFNELLAQLLAKDNLEALIVGPWDGAMESEDSQSAVEALVSARDQLPNLKHLFFGEILQEQTEISWIQQSDLSSLFLAFPSLETLQVRGGGGLSLGRPSHSNLRKLVIETGGLPSSVVREVASANLPNLEHLELWLGSDNYGNDITEEDLKLILNGKQFPKLRYLGLRNDHQTDATVAYLNGASILGQLDVLDLSLGTLTDDGAAILAANIALKSLKKLDCHFHFMTDAGIAQLKSAFPNTELDASEIQKPDEYNGEVYRYNFVSE